MPWDFHVTRRSYAGERGCDIPMEDWLAVVDADPMMDVTTSAFHRPAAERLSAALWFGHPASDGAHPVRFEWIEGKITAARPDRASIVKLGEFAGLLGGHVEDDDGGWYDARGHFLGHLAAS